MKVTLAITLLAQVQGWYVTESEPFQYNFVAAIYQDKVHVSNGILYQDNLVLTPSIGLDGQVQTITAELFRHDLFNASEAMHRPSWTPQTGIPPQIYNSQIPKTAKALVIYTDHNLAIVLLNSKSNLNTGIHIEPSNIDYDLFLVGWGHSGVVKETLLAIKLTDPRPADKNPQHSICATETVPTSTKFTFKLGSPLIQERSTGYNLIGLLTNSTHPCPSGVAIIPILPYLKDIAKVAITLAEAYRK